MHAATLFLTHGEARESEVEEKMDGEVPAIDVDGTNYLDGHTVYYGDAADLVEETIEKIHVEDTKITTSQEKVLDKKIVEWYADVSTNPGFIGVSSESSGEWLVNRIGVQTGVEVRPTVIDVDGFAEHIREEETAQAWNVSHSRQYGADKEKTSIDYHDSADIAEAANGTIGLGFEYFWDGYRMEGIVYKSGYVALYSDRLTAVWAKWLREEVLPFLEVDGEESEQTTLSEDEQDRAEVAATDGGDDQADESQTSIDDLDTVNVTDGDEDDG